MKDGRSEWYPASRGKVIWREAPSEKGRNMTSALDLIQHDQALQDYWVKRFLASLIDVILVLAPVYVVMGMFMMMGASLWYMGGFASGVIWFLYSVLFEVAAGGTIGKMLFGMKVISTEGKLEPVQVVIKNASKVVAVFIILDVLLGFLIDTNDPRQRLMDRVAKTALVFGKAG